MSSCSPRRTARATWSASRAVSVESSFATCTAASESFSCWSCMSASSGETTTVVLGSSRAGSWKVSDLPAPVGITPSTSSPSSSASMISCWPGRSSRTPKCSRASAMSFFQLGRG
ncbi:hypothetical protein BO221_24710 [Archangium sp. Cb G35]|nr:hypothetical protein BO221_24710 [Archangium sp. Cb G35]